MAQKKLETRKRKPADVASPASMQHLASRLAKARDRKSVKTLYGKALR
jgi:hypothetical protein